MKNEHDTAIATQTFGKFSYTDFTGSLVVSTRKAAQMLGVPAYDFNKLMQNLSVSPVLESVGEPDELGNVRAHRRWSVPQIFKRLETWEDNKVKAEAEKPYDIYSDPDFKPISEL